METNGDKKVAKSCENFHCKNCDYNTSRRSSFNKHIMTLKHQNCNFGDTLVTEKLQKVAANKFTCENCKKEYLSRNGLWKHKKNCFEQNKSFPITSELIIEIIKDNHEMKQILMEHHNTMKEMIINGTHNTINNVNTNSHNKTFNLQFFLNETCKDAMNIMDFVDSIQLQLADLENIGKFGYVHGISNIIIQKLNELDVTERPVHCTDKKREVIYVKDENKWEKEDEKKKKIRKFIKNIVHKNVRLLPQFKEKYPDCIKSNSKYTEQYNKIIIESMGGLGVNDYEKENRIISNITKNITIQK